MINFKNVKICIFILSYLFLLSCGSNSSRNASKTIELNIKGMVCNGCAESIQSSLSKKNGILKNVVNYPKKSAVITFDSTKINLVQIKATIKEAGYEALN